MVLPTMSPLWGQTVLKLLLFLEATRNLPAPRDNLLPLDAFVSTPYLFLVFVLQGVWGKERVFRQHLAPAVPLPSSQICLSSFRRAVSASLDTDYLPRPVSLPGKLSTSLFFCESQFDHFQIDSYFFLPVFLIS